ncbi:hypothetical protein [Hymenobacter convexus]|uniref:hypothetical protein n=1 Tax=Hymenobacter sp. CA1UV-4 TaxID=3063782 RepID=UPI002713446E|nr:hypothetical protein [Hymenobacter sp. CA1UV-4]MDO7851353.1 hypothetical protein [Hymenobacter sp. CA1UV-4]
MTATRKPLRWAKRTRASVGFKPATQALFPYNRKHYQRFLIGDAGSQTPWYGVSFQLASEAHAISRGIDFGLTKFIAHYETLFSQVVSAFDDGSDWVITHDKYDEAWWPNTQKTLSALRTLFAQHQVANEFRGALLLKKQAVFTFVRELLSYPTGVFKREGSFYSDIDVSHSHLPFIIKISSHLNVDFLSTQPALLQEIVQAHRSPVFTIKAYRGTSL